MDLKKYIKEILRHDFLGFNWEWHGQRYDLEDVVSSKGLLPVLVRQGMVTAKAIPRFYKTLKASVDFSDSPCSVTGCEVTFKDDIRLNPFLMFVQDAAHIAYKLAPGNIRHKENVVQLDVIEYPIENSSDELFVFDAIGVYTFK